MHRQVECLIEKRRPAPSTLALRRHIRPYSLARRKAPLQPVLVLRPRASSICDFFSRASRAASIVATLLWCSLSLFSNAACTLAIAWLRRWRSLSLAASSFRRWFSRRRCSLSNASAALRAAVSSVVRGTWSFGFARVFFGLGLGPSPAKSVGRSACSLNGPSDPTGRLTTTPGFDIVAATTSGSSLSPWRLPDGKDCSPRPRLPRPPSSRAPLSPGRKSQEKPGMSSVFAALPTRATS